MITGRWAFAGQVNSSLGELDDRVPFAHSGDRSARPSKTGDRAANARSYDCYTLGLSVSTGLKPIERDARRSVSGAIGRHSGFANSWPVAVSRTSVRDSVSCAARVERLVEALRSMN
jgi:hypothetical protein